MKRLLFIAALALAALFAVRLSQPPIKKYVHPPLTRDQTPAFHGADALEICPDGSITAYEWRGDHYRIMWRRNADG